MYRSISLTQLADYYGFNLEAGVANEMTDEQILETLQMQAALDIETALQPSSKPEDEAVIVRNTASVSAIPMVNIASSPNAREKMSATDVVAIRFLENCVLGDLVSKDTAKETVMAYLLHGGNVRMQDYQSEMALHKLARFKVTEQNVHTYRECVQLLLQSCGRNARRKVLSYETTLCAASPKLESASLPLLPVRYRTQYNRCLTA